MSQVAIGARFAFKQNYADRPTHATGKNSHEQRAKNVSRRGKPRRSPDFPLRLSSWHHCMKPRIQPSIMGVILIRIREKRRDTISTREQCQAKNTLKT